MAEADSKQENRALSAAHSEDGKQSCGRGSLGGAARRKALSEEGTVLDLSDGREPALRGVLGPGGEAAVETPAQGLGGITGSLGLLGWGGGGEVGVMGLGCQVVRTG